MTDSKYSILTVDDEEVIVEQMVDIFEDDYDVFSISDPTKALDIVKEKNIDVVISDQRMPQMKGTELLKQVKEYNENTVRILLTGYADLNVAIDAINEGSIHKYEQKPLDVARIREVVTEELQEYEKRLLTKEKADMLDKIEGLYEDDED